MPKSNEPATYSPAYDGPIAGWLVNHVAANHWRVSRIYDRDELLQEGYIVFMRCAAKYPDMDTPQHFMSLFQTAWRNFVHDASNENTKRKAEVSMTRASDGDGDATYERESVGETDNEGALAVQLRQAPSEVLQVLSMFLNAPSEILELALKPWHGRDRRTTSGGSKTINRLLGLPEDQDTMKAVEDYFKQ